MSEAPHDVIVIGGGITGVQIMRELTLRGARVLLLDKADVGSGTSSATTKFIHGGLRYLEQGDLPTVYASLRERRRLSVDAPTFVRPQRFLLPVWRWTRPRRSTLAAGLALYELIAANKNHAVAPQLRTGRAAWLGRSDTLHFAPWLEPEGLLGAFAYYDMANLHPERLLLALLRSGIDLGAHALNYARVDQILVEQGEGSRRACGVRFTDMHTGRQHDARARAIVNAAGPWVDSALGDLNAVAGLKVKRAKGVHLLTRPFPGADAVFTRTLSGRHVVVAPWQGLSLIGPTDTLISQSADDAELDADDLDLLDGALDGISTRRLHPEDLLGYCLGVRPLVDDGPGETYGSTRGFRVHRHESCGVRHLWSVSGGKWTTGRAIGSSVAQEVVQDIGLGTQRELRDAPSLHGALDGAQQVEVSQWLQDKSRLPEDIAAHLIRLYGSDAMLIGTLVMNEPRLARRISRRRGCLDIAAQAVFAVSDESACTLGDVLDRRLVLGTLGLAAPAEIEDAARTVGYELGWDEARLTHEIQERQRVRSRFLQVVSSWEAMRCA